MKRLFVALIAAILVLSLSACVDNGEADNGNAGGGGEGTSEGSGAWWGEDGLETPILPG